MATVQLDSPIWVWISFGDKAGLNIPVVSNRTEKEIYIREREVLSRAVRRDHSTQDWESGKHQIPCGRPAQEFQLSFRQCGALGSNRGRIKSDDHSREWSGGRGAALPSMLLKSEPFCLQPPPIHPDHTWK